MSHTRKFIERSGRETPTGGQLFPDWGHSAVSDDFVGITPTLQPLCLRRARCLLHMGAGGDPRPERSLKLGADGGIRTLVISLEG